MKLHICVVTQQLARVRSGPGLHARNLINHLVRDGHRVSVIAPLSERPEGKLSYSFIGIPGTRIRSHARWIPLAIEFSRALARLVHQETPDLVQFTDARESLFCSADIPLIGHVNDSYSAELWTLKEYRKHYNDGIQRWAYYHAMHVLERLAFRKLDAIVANSHYTAKVIRESYAIPKTRVYVCYKSVEAQLFAPAIQMRAALPPHPPRVLFIGGNMQRKGLPTLIEAAPIILRAIPNVEFWIVGLDPAQSSMEILCTRKGVRHAFHFLGWQSQENLPSLMAQCNLFTMPSLIEAFGVALLEAMASGLPVVATHVGGIVEIVRDGENGLLVPPNAPTQLAEAIIRLLENPALCSQLASAGLATARAFGVAQMMACTYTIYREALARKASSKI